MAEELKDTWPRFFAHWAAATFGGFLRTLLPVLWAWTQPSSTLTFPHWWVHLLIALAVCAVAGLVNSDMPVKPRQLVKSMGLGFAFDAAVFIAKLPPVAGAG